MPDQYKDVSALWVAESNFPIGSGLNVHNHNYYHLFYIREGEAEFPVEDKTYTIHAGESVLAKKYVYHGLKPVENKMLRCLEVKFSVLSSVTERMIEDIPAHIPQDDFVSKLLQLIVEESILGSPNSSAFTTNYLITLINYLYRKYSKTRESDSKVIDTNGLSDLSKHIINYLENNINDRISLQAIADELGLNKNYICSAFKKDTNMTIGDCDMLIRIRKAAELISYSDMNMALVASSTGFANLSHFNRTFKRIVGIPPGHYRKMFSAKLIVPTDIELSPEFKESNGFIVSVLAGKKFSAADVLLHEGFYKEDDIKISKSEMPKNGNNSTESI